ncbi:MAG: T9SS type A sorting domain-containing protein [Ignavibacteria bacterium]|nr:T9SS type A sorting domain-containing protein [Ignavibacteria bacterium]
MKALLLAAVFTLPFTPLADMPLFEKTFGGSENDFACCMRQTADGGYIVAGQTDSFGNGSAHQPDAWCIKLDAAGTREWERTFGEAGTADGAFCVQQCADGGYIVAGSTSSYGGHYPSMWILKLDARGDTSWTRVFEGRIASTLRSIAQTRDGGYIAVGNGDENILKLDSSGNREWAARCGRLLNCVEQTADGGYIIAGDSIYRPLDFGYIPSLSIVKLDARGKEEWRNPLGNSFTGRANAILQCADGGYILAGDSIGFRSASDYSPFLIAMKLDANGHRVWSRAGREFSSAQCARSCADGGVIVAGNTLDDGHAPDMLLMKLDADGREAWAKAYGSAGGWQYASSAEQCTDGGYIVAGQTDSEGQGHYDLWILKRDQNGDGPGPTGISDEGVDGRSGFSLSQNYPNPLVTVTNIEYRIPREADVRVSMFNAAGAMVKSFPERRLPQGLHLLQWNGTDEHGARVPDGLYFYQVSGGGYSLTRRMLVLR